jgi:hypothetical protein
MKDEFYDVILVGIFALYLGGSLFDSQKEIRYVIKDICVL